MRCAWTRRALSPGGSSHPWHAGRHADTPFGLYGDTIRQAQAVDPPGVNWLRVRTSDRVAAPLDGLSRIASGDLTWHHWYPWSSPPTTAELSSGKQSGPSSRRPW